MSACSQTVAPSEATSFARTLPKQTVNKGKIWVIFLLGATGLFGAALAIERNSKLFPAIARANQALAATKAAQKVRHTPVWTLLCCSLQCGKEDQSWGGKSERKRLLSAAAALVCKVGGGSPPQDCDLWEKLG